MRCLIFVVLAFLFLLAASLLATKWIPWWAITLGWVALIVGGFFAVKLLLRNMLIRPFLMKGEVLKGASVQVHGIVPGEKPEYEDEHEHEDETVEGEEPAAATLVGDDEEEHWEDEEPERTFYWVEATITPQPAKGKFTLWEPSELVFIRPEADPSDINDDEDVGEVCETQVWTGSGYGPDEQGKYQGEQRVRLLVGVDPAVREARLKYYFEAIGSVTFPG